jgi:hypothetical protein
MLMLKIFFKNKIFYFNIFLNKKYFKLFRDETILSIEKLKIHEPL